MPAIPVEVVALVGTFVFAAAVTDYREHRIPNYLTVPAAIIGLVYSFLPGWIGPVTAVCGFLVGFGILLLPWILGGGGMGDVKLLAALGVWLGPVYILVAFAGAAAVAAFMAIGMMTYSALSIGMSTTKERYLAAAGNGATSASPRLKAKRVLPFAIPVAVSTGVLLACLWMKNF